VAALICSKCLVAEGDGSLLSISDILVNRVEIHWKAAKSAADISVEGKVAMHMLASTIPWMASVLSGKLGAQFAERVLPIFQRVQNEYQSIYDLGGNCLVFFAYAATVDDDGNVMTAEDKAALCDGPEGSACWDTLWASVHFAVESLQKANACEFLKQS